MALLLLWEKRKGRRSALWGYIAQLPVSVDLPVRWAPEELAELQFRQIIEEVGKRGEDRCLALPLQHPLLLVFPPCKERARVPCWTQPRKA